MHQTGPKVLLPTVCVNQDCCGVGRCVKDGSCSSSSLSKSQRTVLMGYLTISANAHAIKHSTGQFFFQEDSIVRATQSNCSRTLD